MNEKGRETGAQKLLWVLASVSSTTEISEVSRDRLVVRTRRCGRRNPGSNPGHGTVRIFL
jgi:hypothetical protein